ncbi:hypothetical protein KCU98_g8243, partial [Aureobasidium melanogenum]
MADHIARSDAMTSPSSESLSSSHATGNTTLGLGSLGRLPGEIRNLIYSHWIDPILDMCQSSSLKGCLVTKILRQLNACSLGRSSKALSAELRSAFLRKIRYRTLVDTWSSAGQLGHLLDLIKAESNIEAGISSAFGELGVVVDASWYSSSQEFDAPWPWVVDALMKSIHILWRLHKRHAIKSSQLFIIIKYGIPIKTIRTASPYNMRYFPDLEACHHFDPWAIKIHVTNTATSMNDLQGSIDRAEEQLADWISQHPRGLLVDPAIMAVYRRGIADMIKPRHKSISEFVVGTWKQMEDLEAFR